MGWRAGLEADRHTGNWAVQRDPPKLEPTKSHRRWLFDANPGPGESTEKNSVIFKFVQTRENTAQGVKPPGWRLTHRLPCLLMSASSKPVQGRKMHNLTSWGILEKLSWAHRSSSWPKHLQLQCFFWEEETGKSYFLPPKNPSHSTGCWRKVTGYRLSPFNFVLYKKFTKSKVSNRTMIHSGWLSGTWCGVQDDCGGLWPKAIRPDLAEWELLSSKLPKAAHLTTDRMKGAGA